MSEYPHVLPEVTLADQKVRQLVLTNGTIKRLKAKFKVDSIQRIFEEVGKSPDQISGFLVEMLKPIDGEPKLTEADIDELIQYDLEGLIEAIQKSFTLFFRGGRPAPEQPIQIPEPASPIPN